jgi:hypothetical protein
VPKSAQYSAVLTPEVERAARHPAKQPGFSYRRPVLSEAEGHLAGCFLFLYLVLFTVVIPTEAALRPTRGVCVPDDCAGRNLLFALLLLVPPSSLCYLFPRFS